MFTDKLIRENETHIWSETESGLGYVYPKNTFWRILEKNAEECIRIENELTKEYAKTLEKIYGKNEEANKHMKDHGG
jgi:hypothetical protein